MVPGDVALNHAQLFFTRALAGRARVLEVGCGGGQLAWRLAHLGLEVVGLDIAPPPERPSHPGLRFEQGDFFRYEDAPFDAVLFTGALGQLHPLDGALRRARTLLKPGGLIVADELDPLAADEATARWYYEVQGLLAHAGVLPAARLAGQDDAPPLARWEEEHARVPPLHSGAAMRAALRAVGEVSELSRAAWLYRSVCAGLGPSARALNLAQWLLATEERRIAGGSLKGVGLRMICRLG